MFILNPSTALIHMTPQQPQHDNCIKKMTDIYDDNRVNNSTKQLGKTDKAFVKASCDFLHVDYNYSDTTTIMLFSMVGLFNNWCTSNYRRYDMVDSFQD